MTEYPQTKPPRRGIYLVTVRGATTGKVFQAEDTWTGKYWMRYVDSNVIAWQPLTATGEIR